MKTKLFLIFVLASSFFSCLPLKAKEIISSGVPIEFYLIEKLGPSQNEMNNPSSQTKDLFINQLRLAGFHVLYDLEPPFVSKEMVHYGVFQSGGLQSAGIGYVHCSLNDDDTLRYISDSGEDVSLKSKPSSIVWTFEKNKALEMADQVGAKYAFVVEIDTQMVYQSNSPKPVYQIALNADLYQVDKGVNVFHYDQSMVKLASTPQEAVRGASEFLSPQLVEKMQDNPKIEE